MGSRPPFQSTNHCRMSLTIALRGGVGGSMCELSANPLATSGMDPNAECKPEEAAYSATRIMHRWCKLSAGDRPKPSVKPLYTVNCRNEACSLGNSCFCYLTARTRSADKNDYPLRLWMPFDSRRCEVPPLKRSSYVMHTALHRAFH